MYPRFGEKITNIQTQKAFGTPNQHTRKEHRPNPTSNTKKMKHRKNNKGRKLQGRSAGDFTEADWGQQKHRRTGGSAVKYFRI